MDLDFRTFSPRSFERLAQALAARILGPGLMVFGDGPDGGREAAYDGTVNFPTSADAWTGYTVMQAKFLQVPKNPAGDADWLAAQLEADLKKFAAKDSQLRKPQYYILVSNARLSAVPASTKRKGGIAKVDAVFENYKQRLGLVDWRVWHLDQLITYLAEADGIRRSFAAWLTPSDVISDLLEEVGSRRRTVGEALYRYISRELRTHQPVRLQQAGYSGETATMIEDVFTDLPFKKMDTASAAIYPSLLSMILERSRDRLDRESVEAQVDKALGRPERVLLIGGPGQGKSTVSQFMGQILRANALKLDRVNSYSPDVSRIIEGTLTAAKSIFGDQPLPRRLPFRIDLPTFADRLSDTKNKRLTLLRYLADEIAQIADGDIGIEDVRRWIVEQPTAFVLDGLDEVPPSSNRAAVIQAISEFWDEAPNADLQMVVTTRPQGYNDDLDPSLYAKYEMTPFNPEQAVAYAIRLADNRLSDRVQRERVIGRIKEAARSPTTSRLMVSPLQVAILLALIDQRGDAPRDRWTLFDKYFAVVLEREQGKVGLVGETMRRWSRQIIWLHHRAGFLLHVDAETRGNSEAYLTETELRTLVCGQLEEEGYEGDDLDRITSELLAASTERLVLLVQREEGRFGFEVRSLQEFMAAAYLMGGSEAIVQQRLETIANRNHWLHVFQIAASKCFAVSDTQHLRDSIVTICRALNQAGDELDRYLRTGSILALSLLDDGLAYDAPKYRRLLLSICMEILVLGPELLPDDLTHQCALEQSRTVEYIRPYMSSTIESTRSASWLLLLRLFALDCEWAFRVLDGEISKDSADCGKLVALTGLTSKGAALDAFVRSLLEQTTLDELAGHIDQIEENRYGCRKRLEEAFPCLRIFSDRGDKILPKVILGTPTNITLPFVSIDILPEREDLYADVPDTPTWEAVRAVRKFHSNPSATSLASLLSEIEDNGWNSIFENIRLILPWPLLSVFHLGQSTGNIRIVAAQVAGGGFGDVEDWRHAEVRWREKGVTLTDLDYWKDGKFFGSNIGEIGAPYTQVTITGSLSEAAWIQALITLGMQSTGQTRIHFREMVAFILSVGISEYSLNAAEAVFMLEGGNKGRLGEALDPHIVARLSDDLLSDTSIFDLLDTWGRERHVYISTKHHIWREETVRALVTGVDTRPGLIAFVGSVTTACPALVKKVQVPLSTLSVLQNGDIAVVEGYARLLGLIYGDIRPENIDRIFDIGEIDEFPPGLLNLILNTDAFGRDFLHKIGDLTAARLNMGVTNIRTKFGRVLRSVADQRLAPFAREECWKSLALGETFFKLVGRRAARDKA
ncbi:NACHT domain-containing protein [Asaia spathodeae]|uniref:NACHT domain-containing protein n=1 Tax=Asaia spathodeae TaxID=657016 RepID=A0ABX2P6E3_9PROT|nr:hypothetical protein [Asaia spathodeae]GBR19646.1 hypothetical protein AA105894_2363 [Asaia spathodeae NBRC 105894]